MIVMLINLSDFKEVKNVVFYENQDSVINFDGFGVFFLSKQYECN